MKQTVFAKFFCAALAAALLAACAAQPQSASQAESAGQSAPEGALRPLAADPAMIGEMTLADGALYLPQYVFVQNGSDEAPIYDSWYLLLRMDLETMTIAPACAVEGCRHDGHDCPAYHQNWSPAGLIEDGVRTSTQTVWAGAPILRVERQTLDGTGLRETLSSRMGQAWMGVYLDSASYTDGEAVYCLASLPMQQGETSPSWQWVRIALADGDMTAVPLTVDKGAYLTSESCVTDAGEAVVRSELYNVDGQGGMQIAYYALRADGTMRELWQPPAGSLAVGAGKDALFAAETGTGALTAFDLHSEQALALENTAAGAGETSTNCTARQIGEFAVVRRGVTDEAGAWREEAFAVPLGGGERTDLTLTRTAAEMVQGSANAPLEVVCETPQGLLVLTEYRTLDSGATRSIYALISEEDYFANRGEYRAFTYWDEADWVEADKTQEGGGDA